MGNIFFPQFVAFLDTHGTIYQSYCSDTPPQNGRAERKYRHLLDIARSLLLSSSVSSIFREKLSLLQPIFWIRCPLFFSLVAILMSGSMVRFVCLVLVVLSFSPRKIALSSVPVAFYVSSWGMILIKGAIDDLMLWPCDQKAICLEACHLLRAATIFYSSSQSYSCSQRGFDSYWPISYRCANRRVYFHSRGVWYSYSSLTNLSSPSSYFSFLLRFTLVVELLYLLLPALMPPNLPRKIPFHLLAYILLVKIITHL